jgi:hypothetical protein
MTAPSDGRLDLSLKLKAGLCFGGALKLYRARFPAALTPILHVLVKAKQRSQEQKRFILFQTGVVARITANNGLSSNFLIVGLLVSALLALALYLTYRSPK